MPGAGDTPENQSNKNICFQEEHILVWEIVIRTRYKSDKDKYHIISLTCGL